MKFKESLIKFKSFIIECKRVWTVTKKPGKDEFKGIIKITGLGIAAIGALGFLISMLWHIIK